MVKLLEALTRANVEINSDATVPGPNTIVNTNIKPENWVPWHGFDYATLTAIFERELDQQYRGGPQPRPLRKDLCISNEETLEDLLRRFVSPEVNYALERQTSSCHFGRGSRCGTRFKPDWSVVSDQLLDDYGAYVNVLPGDTKLNSKWRPEMVNEPQNYEEWQRVLAQIVTYMAFHHSRYGFIITDKVLVALRITRCRTETQGYADRPTRAAAAAGAAAYLAQLGDVSLASGSTYYDDDPLLWDYHDPEYAIVPWDAKGEGRLTVKLALWCLAMMAANGDNDIDYSYPSLDSWRLADGGKGYVHNTSGVWKPRLPRNARYEERNPAEPSGSQQPQSLDSGVWEGSGSAGDAGQGYWDAAGPSSSQDALHFSQPATPFYSGGPEEEGEEEEGAEEEAGYHEHGVGDEDDNDNDNDNDDDGDDDQTVVGRSIKRMTVVIKKQTFPRGLYFVDYKGKKRTTSRDEWHKVDGGYELRGRRHVYFTKRFP